MPTAITIVNNAIVKLGGKPISSFTQGTSLANAANDVYPTARDAVLTAAPWNFATFYATLAGVELADDSPVYKWGWQYSLPTQPYCLKVREVEHCTTFEIGMVQGPGPLYQLSRVLWANAETLNITYTGRVEDLVQWDGLAVKALEKYLEAELAILVTSQATKRQAALEEFAQLLLPAARVADGQEGTPHQVRPSRYLINIRHGRGSW